MDKKKRAPYVFALVTPELLVVLGAICQHDERKRSDVIRRCILEAAGVRGIDVTEARAAMIGATT